MEVGAVIIVNMAMFTIRELLFTEGVQELIVTKILKEMNKELKIVILVVQKENV